MPHAPNSRTTFLVTKGVPTISKILTCQTIPAKAPKEKILEGKFSDRRIGLNFCEISKLHYFGLGANFDQTLLSLNKVPKVKAVYRISYKDTIQNIGETNNLARRLKEKGITEVLASKGVTEIPMDKVEYSVMENATDEQRRDCEWEHLNKHKEQFGHYPPFNHQGGRKVQN